MNVSLADIRSFLVALPDVSVHDSTQDLFFFRGDEQKFPFATVVTHDDPFDNLSKLDQPGVFRLNFVTDKPTFATLFPDWQTKAALAAADIDYAVHDVLFPHPIYGGARWVSIVNPSGLWEQCRGLLTLAHQRRESRPDSW